MAAMRDRPYVQFNFLVDLGDGSTDGPQAGFAEVSGLGEHLQLIEYRNGNSKFNAPLLLTGLARPHHVTLRRGLMGSLALANWFKDLRSGQGGLRNVTITLQNEQHEAVMVWHLRNARIMKHSAGPLNAKGSDVAMEELVLAGEQLDWE
jgi:phage tail-like protein